VKANLKMTNSSSEHLRIWAVHAAYLRIWGVVVTSHWPQSPATGARMVALDVPRKPIAHGTTLAAACRTLDC
jgi:hypothetical protein